MTIYRFALLPTWCGKCGRWFIFEKFKTYEKSLGVDCKSIKLCKCSRCIEQEEKYL